MAKFKALFSKTQTFSFDGVGYQFSDGYFHTDDEKLINFLVDNHGCELVEELENELSLEKNDEDDELEEDDEEVEKFNELETSEEAIENKGFFQNLVNQFTQKDGE